MIRHIFKIIRSQFRSNLWILTELFVTFVVVWLMVDYFCNQFVLTHKPVGFETENVYSVVFSITSPDADSFIKYDEGSPEPLRNFRHIIDRLSAQPEIEQVAYAYISLPYTLSNYTNGFQRDTTEWFQCRGYQVSPGYFCVFHITDANTGDTENLEQKLTQDGYIIGENLAEAIYGRRNVVGEALYCGGDTLKSNIIAVSESIRNDEYNTRYPWGYFIYLDLNKAISHGFTESDLGRLQVVFRIRPNVNSSDFADRFFQRTKSELQAGNFQVSSIIPYNDIRRDFLRNHEAANTARLISTVGGFLLANIFLAIIGTFWFRISRRRAELGLRMALGSSRGGIFRFCFLEGLILLTLAAVPAILVCANLLWGDIVSTTVMPQSLTRFLTDVLISWLVLALTILLGIAYPAWQAATLRPADALHEEG